MSQHPGQTVDGRYPDGWFEPGGGYDRMEAFKKSIRNAPAGLPPIGGYNPNTKGVPSSAPMPVVSYQRRVYDQRRREPAMRTLRAILGL